MLLVAIASLLCIVWAVTIPDLGVTVLSSIVALFAFYQSFKMKGDASEKETD